MLRLAALLALSLFVVLPPAVASPRAAGELELARAEVAAGRLAEARERLARLVEAEPDNAAGWHLYGYVLHARGELDAALVAHERAASFPATAAKGSYNAACVHALKGRVDEAIAWLEKAKAAGFTSWALAAGDPDLAGLRGDPRFEALLPRGGGPPFTRAARLLHDSFGEAPNDQYGWVARRVGDVDGDGAQDFATTAPFHASGRGAVYVFSGRGGALLHRWVGAPGDQLGWCVAAAGDQDGDGRADVLIGAPGGGRMPGRAYVRAGADGAVLRTLAGEGPGDGFGKDVAAVGDLDGDGRDELLVGAPGHDGAGQDAGRAYLYGGGPDGVPFHAFDGRAAGDRLGESVCGWFDGGRGRLYVAAPRPGAPAEGRLLAFDAKGLEPAWEYEPPASARHVAWFLSVVGDVDGDGVPDVYHTDWNDAAKGPTTGRATVQSGLDGRVLLELEGTCAGEGFGIGVGDAGDLDGDGADDLVVGAWTNAEGAPQGGKVYLYSGRDGAPLGSLTGAAAGATLGFDATSLGDLDGDGVPDLLLTAAWDATRGVKAGRTLVVSGASALDAAKEREEPTERDGR